MAVRLATLSWFYWSANPLLAGLAIGQPSFSPSWPVDLRGWCGGGSAGHFNLCFTGQPNSLLVSLAIGQPSFPLRGLSSSVVCAMAVRLDTLTFVLLDNPTPSRMLSYWTAQFVLVDSSTPSMQAKLVCSPVFPLRGLSISHFVLTKSFFIQ
jgi:hypothetical protein